MNAAIALSIVGVVLLGTIALGVWGVRRVRMDPHQLIVGGRSFGTLFLWVLLAGEIYTSFTFLGAAGWAYGKGAPAYYILCYATLAYIMSYFLGPLIWRVSHERKLLTGPDFFVAQYGSRALGRVGFAGQCRLHRALHDAATLGHPDAAAHRRLRLRSTPPSRWAAAFALIILFVFAVRPARRGLGESGQGCAGAAGGRLRGGLAADAFLRLAGGGHRPRAGHASGLADVERRPFRAGHAVVRLDGRADLARLLHVAAVDGRALLRAQRGTHPAQRDFPALLPIAAAAGVLRRMDGAAADSRVWRASKADESFMLVVQRYYPPWVLGVVAAAGCLAGLVPASVQLLAAASILSKNVLADQFGIARDAAAQTWATRGLVLLVAGAAFVFWLVAKATLVGLLLIAYNGITQLFPGVALSFLRRRPAALSIGLGILAGILVLAWAAITG